MAECRVCGELYPKEREALDCYLGHYERHGPCPDADDCWVCVEKGYGASHNAASDPVVEGEPSAQRGES